MLAAIPSVIETICRHQGAKQILIRTYSATKPKLNTSHILRKISTQKNNATILHKGYMSSRFTYFRGWAYQQVFLNRRINYKRSRELLEGVKNVKHASLNRNDYGKDRILVFEHEHVYTLGRGADEKHLPFLNEKERHLLSRKNTSNNSDGTSRLYVDKFKTRQFIDDQEESIVKSVQIEVDSMEEPPAVISPTGAPVYRIERGGEVTYHGPGQLVCYPLLDLSQYPYKQDLHWYLHSIEEVIIQTLNEYGVKGVRDDINTGVWVDGKKIAAVGVSSSRWITTHGFALNIDPDLNFFDTSMILPCGIEGRGVTSISHMFKEQERNEEIPCMDEVTNTIVSKFENVFDLRVEIGSNLL